MGRRTEAHQAEYERILKGIMEVTERAAQEYEQTAKLPGNLSEVCAAYVRQGAEVLPQQLRFEQTVMHLKTALREEKMDEAVDATHHLFSLAAYFYAKDLQRNIKAWLAELKEELFPKTAEA